MENAAIKKAQKEVQMLAEQYEVTASSIVWMGGNSYIVCKDNKEIKVDI